MTINSLTDDSLIGEVLENSGAAVVMFSHPTFKPCAAMRDKLSALQARFAGVRFLEIDMAENMSAASLYDVRVAPTLMLFKAGKPAGTLVEVQKEAAIAAWIRRLLP